MPLNGKSKAFEAITDIRDRVKSLQDAEKTREETMKSMEAKYEVRLAAIEKAMQERPGAISVPGVEDDKFSFARAIYAMASGDWSQAGYEKEVFQESAKRRDASLGNDQNLGNLVPTQVMKFIVPLLRSKLILPQLGVTMLPTLSGGVVEIPRESVDSTGYWVGENTAPTATDAGTEMIRLRPHKAAALIKFSNTLIRTGADAEPFVRDSIAKKLARLIQKAFFEGLGSGGEPLGIANKPGINTLAIAGVTVIKLQQMLEEIEADDADIGSMAWAFSPRAKAEIAQLNAAIATGGVAPILTNGDVSKGDAKTLLGIPYHTTSDISIDTTPNPDNTDIYLGVWAESIMGSWGALELKSTQEAGTAFEKDQTWVRAIQEVDVGLFHPTAICVGTNLNL